MLKQSIITVTAAIVSLSLLAGCGEDSPTAPAGGGGNAAALNGVTVSTGTLDYGIVCFGSDKTQTIMIKANDDNTGEATGRVAVSQTADGSYNIESGGGDYTLAPGEERQVQVRYNPQKLYRTHSGALDVFVDSDETVDEPMEVELTGYSSARPYLEFAPAGGVVPAYDTNYRPLSASDAVTVAVDGNVDYADPGWLQCNGPTWIFNGNSVTESRVWFEFNVPSGTTKMTVTLTLEAEGDCTQLLVEIDGTEHVWENLGGRCQTISKTLNISPGKRDIRIGTDQSALCGDDLAIWDVKFQFNRSCLSSNEVF